MPRWIGQFVVTLLSVSPCVAMLGCAVFAPQATVNHARADGVVANDPLLVDGVFIIATEVPIPGRLHLRSTHEEPVEGTSVRLPSPRLVSKIVVHATGLVEFDVIVEGPGSGGWQLLTTVRKTGARSTVAPVPGVRRLAAVRIRPRKARDDRWNVEISEIELFGPATDPAP